MNENDTISFLNFTQYATFKFISFKIIQKWRYTKLETKLEEEINLNLLL